jgi:hypothetical protein
MPSLTFIGIDHNNRSFFIAFAFLPDQTEESYKWALEHTKELYNRLQTTICISPSVISTDCDQALRNALSGVFPESRALLCLSHANKNIRQHYEPKFTTAEAYNEFFEARLGIVQLPDIPEYQSRVLQFSA